MLHFFQTHLGISITLSLLFFTCLADVVVVYYSKPHKRKHRRPQLTLEQVVEKYKKEFGEYESLEALDYCSCEQAIEVQVRHAFRHHPNVTNECEALYVVLNKKVEQLEDQEVNEYRSVEERKALLKQLALN